MASPKAKPEGKCRQYVTAAVCGITADQHGGSATKGYQNKCADELGQILAYTLHNYLLVIEIINPNLMLT